MLMTIWNRRVRTHVRFTMRFSIEFGLILVGLPDFGSFWTEFGRFCVKGDGVAKASWALVTFETGEIFIHHFTIFSPFSIHFIRISDCLCVLSSLSGGFELLCFELFWGTWIPYGAKSDAISAFRE